MNPSFLWGVATSAYQIEGAVDNDWTSWEAAGRLRARTERCGVATRHRDRWQADLALLPTINANAYRFSVEWSRLEPRPGEPDLDALALEVERVDYLRRLGIEPVVTLHHYTHPRWFWEEKRLCAPPVTPATEAGREGDAGSSGASRWSRNP
jgi:beta-glucosidase